MNSTGVYILPTASGHVVFMFFPVKKGYHSTNSSAMLTIIRVMIMICPCLVGRRRRRQPQQQQRQLWPSSGEGLP